jgi:hypothetical protein
MVVPAKARIPGKKPPQEFLLHLGLLHSAIGLKSCILHPQAVGDVNIMEDPFINALSNQMDEASLNSSDRKPAI